MHAVTIVLSRWQQRRAARKERPARVVLWCEFPLCDEPVEQFTWISVPDGKPLRLALCPLHRNEHVS